MQRSKGVAVVEPLQADDLPRSALKANGHLVLDAVTILTFGGSIGMSLVHGIASVALLTSVAQLTEPLWSVLKCNHETCF